GTRAVATTYGKGQILAIAFRRDLSPMVPQNSEDRVLSDDLNRGYLNIFRLASTKEANAWEDIDSIRIGASSVLIRISTRAQRLNMRAFMASVLMWDLNLRRWTKASK